MNTQLATIHIHLSGPTGVGKSAVSASIADLLRAHGYSVAIPDPSERNNPSRPLEDAHPHERPRWDRTVFVITEDNDSSEQLAQKKVSTPAKRAGFEEGDPAILKNDTKELSKNDLVRLEKDDGTVTPRWEVQEAKDKGIEKRYYFIAMNQVAKLQPIEQTSPATLSPAERAGFKVGDYAIKNDGYIAKLDLDNGTDRPVWKNIEGVHKDNTSRTHVSQVRRLVPVQEDE